MKKVLIKVFNKFLSLINLRLINSTNYNSISKLPRSFYLYSMISDKQKEKVLKLLHKSKSQLAQDIFVVANTEIKENNFFVEFGATDGITISNTFLLEKELNWNGILIEPASIWHESLEKNRNCIIDKRAIFSISGETMKFLVVENNKRAEPGLSSLKKFANNGDWASNIRLKNSREEIVETISLNDLLDFYNAPKLIDYISIDTEGSELDIIKHFDFKKRTINIISIEHNYHKNRDKIHSKLTKEGYKRVFENLSKFDDWYIIDK